jgi:hypothetical protein
MAAANDGGCEISGCFFTPISDKYDGWVGINFTINIIDIWQENRWRQQPAAGVLSCSLVYLQNTLHCEKYVQII